MDNVATLTTQRDLHAGPAMPQFVVAGFGPALVAGLITGGRLGDLYGRRRMFVLGLGLFTLALRYGLLAVAAVESGTGWLIPGLLVAGYGMGLVMAPLPTVALTGVEPRHAASAAGVISTSLQAGGAIGVAVVGVVFYDVLGAADHFAGAFGGSLVAMAAFCAGSAALVRLLPRR